MGNGIDPLLIAAFAGVEAGGKSGFGSDVLSSNAGRVLLADTQTLVPPAKS